MIDADRAENELPGLTSQTAPGPKSRRETTGRPSFRTRLILIVSLTSAIIYTGITYPFYSVILLNVTRDAEAFLREQARVVQTMLPRERQSLEKALAVVPLGVFSLQMTGTNGIPRVKSGPLAGELPLPAKLPELVRHRGARISEGVRRPSQQG